MDGRVNVVGVDPAPKKDTTICTLAEDRTVSWRSVANRDLPGLVTDLAERDGVLVCWDSPLTAGDSGSADRYYQRTIERFFSVAEGWTVPKGISVRPYAGCPHWAVTRAVLGLPRVGRFDVEDVPLRLYADGGTPRPGPQDRAVVEVHPAVALWMWCKPHLPAGPWTYKKDESVLRSVWATLKSHAGLPFLPSRPPASDDELDAFVALALGTLWLGGDRVVLLGDETRGSFLLPKVEGLEAAFATFCASVSA